MKNKLDEIPWNNLRHAYGFANDVPKLIRDLGSNDIKIINNALYELHGNIWHQGTRYEATPFVIPFIYELLQNKNTLLKERLIHFLVRIALGQGEEYLPEGLNIKKFRQTLKEEQNNSIEEEEGYIRFKHSPIIELECYEIVNSHIPILQSFVEDTNSKIRDAAIFALGWFPDFAQSSMKLISDKLNELDNEESLASGLLSLGLLNRNRSFTLSRAYWNEYLNSSLPLVKLVTAMNLAKQSIDQEIVTVLLESLKNAKELHRDGIFDQALLEIYICQLLVKYSIHEKDIIIPELLQILSNCEQYEYDEIPITLIDLVISNKETIRLEFTQLSKVEQLALQAIADNECWESVMFPIEMQHRELPNTREKFKKYINKE